MRSGPRSTNRNNGYLLKEKLSMSEKRVIITGATGMVGGCALRICLNNPDVFMVTSIGRSR